MGIINRPNSYSSNTTISPTEVNDDFNTLYNEFNGSIAAANLGTDSVTTAKIADSNVTTAKIADSAVTAGKIDFGGSGVGIWWEEIGRTTLGTAGDTLTVSSLPARTHLQLRVILRATGGTISAPLTFNGDTSSNYSLVRLENNGSVTAASATSQASIALSASTTATHKYYTIDVFNISTLEKTLVATENNASTAGAGTAPIIRITNGKWVNTSNAISSITITNSGTGDYAIGSEIVVLGHN
jgi:hypothetical protein